MEQHRVVSRQEWLAARKQHLLDEKKVTKARDELARQRRELPWVKVDKSYTFETRAGRKSLADLFGSCSQLIVYHFMFGPDWPEGCPSCSILGDHMSGSVAHLAQRDVSLVAVSRAPLPKLEAFQQRMGWSFPWVSSAASDFNFDYGVSFTKEQVATGKVDYNFDMRSPMGEEMPGTSVFYKDAAGNIFHTYSAYARGLELLMGVYNWLDLAPEGRDEDGLPFTMAWVRHHDRYQNGHAIAAGAPQAAPATSEESCPACHEPS